MITVSQYGCTGVVDRLSSLDVTLIYIRVRFSGGLSRVEGWLNLTRPHKPSQAGSIPVSRHFSWLLV